MNSSSKKHKAPWFSYQGTYFGNDPFYYNTADFEWAKTIEDNYDTIKTEIDSFLLNKENTLNPYFNVDLVTGKNIWNVDVFYFWGKRNEENCKFIPQLEKTLISIPGFTSAALSVLEGNTKIDVHNGDTDATIRGHLAIKIPDSLPECGFEVGGVEKSWEEGKLLLFSDAQPHRAWNNSKGKRYVLMIDVIKTEYISIKKDVCANAHSLIALQQLEYKFPIVKKLPGFIRGIIRRRLKNKSVRQLD